jgi:TRAP-type C4-dicarboxylate transport system substrate-binding protein
MVFGDTVKRIEGDVAKTSGGRVFIKSYLWGVMGNDEDMLRKKRLGQLDIVGLRVIGAYIAYPELAVMGSLASWIPTAR